jgi:hypothetical protein
MEKKSQPILGLIRDPTCGQIGFTAPPTAGPYRLFVTAMDGQGHIAYGKKPAELYDIQADPREWNNLASNPEHTQSLAWMRTLAEEHRKKSWQ